MIDRLTSDNILNIIDISSVVFILLSILTIVLSAVVSQRTRYTYTRIFQIFFLLVFITVFGLINLLYDINTVRISVLLIFVLFITPYSITFISVWSLSANINIGRIQNVTFVSWLIALCITMLLRGIIGWGIPTNIIGSLIFIAISSVADGMMGGVIGYILIHKLEEYRPTTN